MAVAMSLGPPPTLIQLQALSLRIFAVNALNIQFFELIKLYGGLEWYHTNLATLLTNNAWHNKCWGEGGLGPCFIQNLRGGPKINKF